MQKLKIKNCYISTPLIDIIKKLQEININGKLRSIKVRKDNIRITCPVHKGGQESRPSADIYIGSQNDKLAYGWFHCFTCDAQGPFYKFVAECLEISEAAAKQWLIDNFADEFIEYDVELPSLDLSVAQKPILDENILKSFEDFHPYMMQRKLSKRIIELFEIKYDPRTNSLVFPVRDGAGQLSLLVRRSVSDKKFNIPEAADKPLYLMHYIKAHNIQTCMITEGPIDALTACSYGFPCVATLGSISDHQIDLINKSNIRILYTMFDNDFAGYRFQQKLMRKIRKDILVINVPINIPGRKDINDLSQDEFYQCVEAAEQSF